MSTINFIHNDILVYTLDNNCVTLFKMRFLLKFQRLSSRNFAKRRKISVQHLVVSALLYDAIYVKCIFVLSESNNERYNYQ